MDDRRDHLDSEKFPPGIYELLINEDTDRSLSRMPADIVSRRKIGNVKRSAERVLADRIRDEVVDALKGRPLDEQLRIANDLMRVLRNGDAAYDNSYGDSGYMLTDEVLVGIERRDEQIHALPPSISVASNAVFTASARDPQLYYELVRETETADAIDMIVSFIRWSGVDIMMNALETFARRGGKLRIITTTYMGVTELRAIERLAALPHAEVRISYNGNETRLHAKAYVFHRNSGYSTAYVGSSNMSRPALTEGFEWNTRIACAESPEAFDKVRITADEYWNDPQFELYTPADRDRLAAVLAAWSANAAHAPASSSQSSRLLTEGSGLKPFAYQLEILDQLEAERVLHGSFRNLVVAATGTGKTAIAAFDYRRWRENHSGSPCRLLFVAHREEILRQSLETFRNVLGDPHFGELHVGGVRAASRDNLFISIQSANATDLFTELPSDHYDYIVVDEFHHAAAPSYQKLVTHFAPGVLLGLTATPERHDGRSILDYFDGRIAAEIRLPSAIDQGILCPFHYYGLPDTVDLDTVRWTRGGYDAMELENVYTLNRHIADKRSAYILDTLEKRAGGLDGVKALGFCVSKKHAEYMASYFVSRGVAAMAVTSDTPRAERHDAVRGLAAGRLKVLFAVDIFNEGVDIPEVNTVLFLRPTESLTIFLQQLGRGLRLSAEKDFLLVLDYIGQANRNYSFGDKFSSLLRRNSGDVRYQVEHQFPAVPRGCSVELVGKAADNVLNTISRGFSTIAELRRKMEEYVANTGNVPTFAEFVNHFRLNPSHVLQRCLFSTLTANVQNTRTSVPDAMRQQLRAGLFRMCACNAPRWMIFLAKTIPTLADADFAVLSEEERLMLAMFYLTIWNENISGIDDETVQTRLREIAASQEMCRDVTDVLEYLVDKNDRMSEPYRSPYACPLEVNGSYMRNQIFAAVGNLHPKGNQEGVLYAADRRTDVLLVTLSKGKDQFSESTMYADYAINRYTFHWQSQNRTTPQSAAGQRYINQQRDGTHVLLFVRRTKYDAYGRAASYRFAGPVSFVQTTGSRPMNVIWRLERPLDPVFYQEASRVAVENI